MRIALRRTALALAALAVAVTGTATATAYGEEGPAVEAGQSTAALEPVSDFGSNPGALSMYRYVPDELPAGSPVVVVMHGCTQDAKTYFDGAGWQHFADKYHFSVVAPQQSQNNNMNKCFNWFQPGDVARDGGEALSVKQMVDRTVTDVDADSSKVFVTGLSAGGAMTASMMAAYPEVFAGGAVIGGLPHDCARTVVEAFSCMNPGTVKSAQEWGDRVRAAAPEHSGARPKVSVWHGTADATVKVANATESVKQWTDVLGADQEADATEELPGNTTRSDYTNGEGQTVVRSYLVDGMGHGTPVKPDEQCGTAGDYFLDTICSSAYITQDWGLTG